MLRNLLIMLVIIGMSSAMIFGQELIGLSDVNVSDEYEGYLPKELVASSLFEEIGYQPEDYSVIAGPYRTEENEMIPCWNVMFSRDGSVNLVFINALSGEMLEWQQERAPLTEGMCLYTYVPFYSQKDPHWYDKHLGSTKCTTIGTHGCHLCCVAMLYAKWGYGEANPPFLNRWHNYYIFDCDEWGCCDYIKPKRAMQYAGKPYPSICRNVQYIGVNDIWGHLSKGHPVIVVIKMGDGMHFMVIFGHDGYRYWVKDPLKSGNGECPLYGYPVENKYHPYRVYGY